MTRAIFSLRFILLIWTGIFFRLSFAQADGWCPTRFTKDNTTSSTELKVVDNPMKEVGINESNRVLKLSNIDRRGCICLNLTRYIGDAKDRITDIGRYDRLRFKYYIVNSLYPDYKVRIRMNDGGKLRLLVSPKIQKQLGYKYRHIIHRLVHGMISSLGWKYILMI